MVFDSVVLMTNDQLCSEWLACERFIGDPDDDPARLTAAYERQHEVEMEQQRRSELGGKNSDLHNDNE